jgi:hypothetical protein
VIPAQRRPEQAPGDLYLDPTVPARERLTVSCGDWVAEATHVWTGTGWSRLLIAPVRAVPGAAADAAAPQRSAASARQAAQAG